jgi:hypothetical protein
MDMKTKEVTVTDTAGMIALARDAAYDSEAKKPRNRSVVVDKLTQVLYPEGTHVLMMSMPHEHVQGAKVVPHLRTHWMVAVKEGVKPNRRFAEGGPPSQEIWLDVSFDAMQKYTLKQTVDIK